MVGYWPSSFFRVFMDRNVHKHTKKERGQYPAILIEQAWSIKELLYGFQGNFCCGTRRVVSIAAQDLIHLACSRSWFCFKDLWICAP